MKTSITRPVWGGILALVAILIAGSLLISAYVQKERQRDLDAWSIRLGQVAETRVQAIEDWLALQQQSLNELANNASLQLYLWQLSQHRDSADSSDEPAQLGYLRNLILASAERYGFTADGQQSLITANVPQRRANGLALFDAGQRRVVATSGMPEIGAALAAAVELAQQTGRVTFSELVLDAHDRVLFGIAVPVPAVLGAQTDSGSSGVILGVHNAARTLYPLLNTGVALTAGDESLLLKSEDRQVLYLSPTRGGGVPTRKSLPLDRSNLAAAVAVTEPGSFGLFRNYLGHAVLATSRSIPSSPWVLSQQVDAGEALQESNRHRRFIITSFSLLLFFFAATLVAAWRHGSSVRARHDAEALRNKSLALQKQTELLHAVTDNTEALIMLLDDQQQLLFANTRLATRVNTDAHELTGQSLGAVIGPANAQPLLAAIEQLHANGEIQHCTREMSIGGDTRIFQCSIVPVDRLGERFNAILLVMQDTTALRLAQRKHATLLRRLVDTLMQVVDLHDPYSANHSARMAEVANAIGRELKLSKADRQTLDMAASLANLGKIFVPREILTKTTALTDAEQDLAQRHVQYGVEMLEDLEFEGQVLDTIRQKQEHLDGSGYPQALSGDDILLTARILAVANAFVALVSPRAYRDAISIQAALDRLLQDAGVKYDRHVVAALFHVAENRSDWSDWQTTI